MKKFLVIILFLTNILFLSSCKKGVRGVIFDDIHKKADVRMEQIYNAIKNRDKDSLKATFSMQALADANDFGGSLDALFDYIQGDIQSWEQTGTYGGTDERNVDGTGNRKKEIQSIYILTTNEQEYEIAIYVITIDTANTDNEGIYSICIINKNDKQEPEVSYWGNGEVGINIG